MKKEEMGMIASATNISMTQARKMQSIASVQENNQNGAGLVGGIVDTTSSFLQAEK